MGVILYDVSPRSILVCKPCMWPRGLKDVSHMISSVSRNLVRYNSCSDFTLFGIKIRVKLPEIVEALLP